jgi:hypothetical protein
MCELTVAARRCLDVYLAEVRSSLRHCPSVDVADVERDVVEHIEHALCDAPVAVDAPELQKVLRGLGSPSQWVPQDELSWLQRALLALRSGPDDLRLGYLALGVLAGTLLISAVLNLEFNLAGTVPFLLLGVAVSFIFARASLSTVSGLSSAERWLIGPSLVIVYLPVTAIMLLWPVPAAILAELILKEPGGPNFLAWARGYPMGTITVFALATLGALWWGFLSFIAWRWPEVIRDCYAPFASTFRRHQLFLVLSAMCLMIFLTCLAGSVGGLHELLSYFSVL